MKLNYKRTVMVGFAFFLIFPLFGHEQVRIIQNTGLGGAAQVTAIDISPEMARIAREKFPQENVTVLCGDAEQAHFPAPFDCIVIYNAFPHFPEPERLLAHLAGLLAPGGTLTVAHGFSRKTLDAHHAKTARQVSNWILPVQELAALFSRYVHVTVQISDEEMYQVAGQPQD